MTGQIREANGLIVDRYEIIGTGWDNIDAWEAYDGHGTYRHTADGVKIGRVGTRQLPSDLEALPRGEDRRLAVGAWYAAQYTEAYAAIEVAFPEAAGAARGMGSVIVPTMTSEAEQP
jgi:hypothetical protein